MKKPRFRLYRAVRKVLGTHLTAALFGYYLYEGTGELSMEKMKSLWDSVIDQVDDSTTHVHVATPDGWECPRGNCTTDFLHTHSTYAALSHFHCWDQEQPSACGQTLASHKQCCLCSAQVPQFDY